MKKNFLTIKNIVDYAAEKYSEKDFCKFFRGDRLFKKSFAQFRSDCIAVSRYIKSIEAEKMHIAFIGKTNYEYIACLTGMIFSGNVVVPFSPDICVEEACMLFKDSDIEMLFCEEEFLEKAEEIRKECSGIRQVVSLGDWNWFDGIFKKYSAVSETDSYSEIETKPDDCALIIYTSGTTGERKGVMLSNRNLAANSTYDTYKGSENEVNLSLLPMHHVFCYACDVLKNLYDGCTICLNGSLTDLYKNFLVFQPSNARIVPLLCKAILTRIRIAQRKHPEYSPREAADSVVGSNLTKLIAGSAFLSSAVIDEFAKYGITARQGYGMSECSPRITTADFSEDNKYSNGVIIGTDDVRVVDGEIQVKGPSVMLGYYKKPERTVEAFTEDGYLHTGDLGYIENNHIYLIGRKKNLIILSNGENISPEEIENKFVDDEIVKEIIVYANKDCIVAEIYPDEHFTASRDTEAVFAEIEKTVDRVNSTLNTDRQIHRFLVRETPFERTTTGKIKRQNHFFEEEDK